MIHKARMPSAQRAFSSGQSGNPQIIPSVQLLLRLLLRQHPLQHIHLEHSIHDQIQQPVTKEGTSPNKSRPPSRPEIIRASEPRPQDQGNLALERILHQPPRIILRLDRRVVLRKRQPALKELLDAHVDAVLRQRAVGLGRDLRLHGSRHGGHDAHAEGLEFQTQGAGVGDYGALAGAVDGAENVGGDGGQGGDVDDEALGGDELVGEGLAHGHNAEDVGLESLADVVDVDVGGGVGVGAAAGFGC